MEQLAAFSRMLTQFGALLEKGYSMEISDSMQALLTNLKSYMAEQEGGALEPVMLNKAAFELLDTKTLEDLHNVAKDFDADVTAEEAAKLGAVIAGL